MAIRMERSDAVATIVIDRPEAKNAVDGPAARALAEAFREFERDDGLRVAVLWGAGGVFCAGADLKARAGRRGLRLAPHGRRAHGPDAVWPSRSPPSPPSKGYAVAGGLELALDVRPARGLRRTPSSACSAGAGACPSSTAAPCACRG